jgi:hypothetical protein
MQRRFAGETVRFRSEQSVPPVTNCSSRLLQATLVLARKSLYINVLHSGRLFALQFSVGAPFRRGIHAGYHSHSVVHRWARSVHSLDRLWWGQHCWTARPGGQHPWGFGFRLRHHGNRFTDSRRAGSCSRRWPIGARSAERTGGYCRTAVSAEHTGGYGCTDGYCDTARPSGTARTSGTSGTSGAAWAARTARAACGQQPSASGNPGSPSLEKHHR